MQIGVRSITVFALMLLLLLSVPSMPVQATEVEGGGEVIVYRVCASYPGEFISLANHGPPVDVQGWRLSDGEGSVIINVSLVLPTGGGLTWSAAGSFFQALYPDERCVPNDGRSVILKGSLKLADAGDQVFLFDAEGELKDVVYYGNVEPQDPWAGPPAVLRKGNVMTRTSSGVGPENWETAVPGLYSETSPTFQAEVIPLLYPENALPELVRQIDNARNSIALACYLMENWTLARHLTGACARGVEVTILLEGRPVGGVSENGAAIAYHLQDAGAKVWTMRSGESFRRYDYLHAKYAIFDQERLFVSSENMADSSFGSNRGWAAIVESEQLCSYAESVFQRDLAAKGVDVFPLNTSLVRSEGGPGRLIGVLPPAPIEFSAEVSLLTSPFNIQDRLVELISAAQERIVVQQMRIEEDWLEGSRIMSALLSAAGRGVSVRIQLDSGLGTEEGNAQVSELLNTLSSTNDWDLECRPTDERSPFGRLHNKGVIVDDAVVVGSANWVDGSMERNREMAVVLRSPELAEVFVDWFEEDWKGDARPPVIVLPWHFLKARAGEPVLLDATGCSDPSGVASIAWDLDGDGLADLRGPVQVVTLGEGKHNITLLVEDPLGNVAVDQVHVMIEAPAAASFAWLIYVPFPVLLSLVLLRRWTRRL